MTGLALQYVLLTSPRGLSGSVACLCLCAFEDSQTPWGQLVRDQMYRCLKRGSSSGVFEKGTHSAHMTPRLDARFRVLLMLYVSMCVRGFAVRIFQCWVCIQVARWFAGSGATLCV